MTDELERWARQLENVADAARLAMLRTVTRFAGELLAYNRAYIEAGEKPGGGVIQPGGYSPAYAAYKRKYGTYRNTAYVDLKLTGAFLDSLHLRHVGGLQFEVEATDAKVAQLLARYGPLLGIRAEDVDDFVETVLSPDISRFIEQYLRA